MARILFGFLLLQIFTLANCHCRDGWQKQFCSCYLFVNARRSHEFAASICKRHGSILANLVNPYELDYVKKNAAIKFTNANQIWIDYSKGKDNDLDGYWNNSQANSSEGNCVSMNNLGLLMVDNCFWQHPFVCQRRACDSGYSCRNDNCVDLSDTCDGYDDCNDNSDEIQCTDNGNYVYNSLSDKISVNKSVLKYSRSWFIIDVPIGYRIKLEFQLYNVTNNNGLRILGIKTSNDYLLVGQPPLNETKFYSRNNFVIVEYWKNNNEVGTVFEFNYTSIAIPSPILQATSNPQELSFPESWTMFLDVELSWKIEATKASVIVLQLFELIFPNSGKNSFFIWYGNDMAVNLTGSTKNQTFTSNTNEVVIYFYSANDDRSASLNLTYQIVYCVSAGYEIGPSRNECIPCAKGFYKNATAEVGDKCSPCPQNFTTSNQRATTIGDCDLKVCMAGEFRNNTSNTCQDCNEGYYQANVERSECLKCPENHTTLSKKSKSKDDCIFYCVSAGYEIGPSRNECIPCAKGFYKNATAEVVEKCSPCPQNFTTSRNQGATTLGDCDLSYYQADVERSECLKCPENHTTLSKKSKSKDDCILVCLAGYVYNRSSVTCMACPKGTYKSKRGYDPCIACTGIMTTFGNASTQETNCLIPNCPAGEEPTEDYLSCKKCSLGYYKSDSSSINCIQCPINTTTLQTGATNASQCQKKIVSNPAILNTVVIVYELQYSFVNCEINQAFYEDEIKSAMEKRIQEMSKEWNFCIGDCQVTVNVKCPTSNRKKRATGNGNTEIQIGNVKSNADSKTKDERTQAKNIFTQDCKVNSIKYQVNSINLMSCVVITSCKYSKLVSDKCELCPAGTKAILTGCEDCPEGTYSGINQRDCTKCKFPLTSKLRSNSSSQCLSKCILDSTYCKNGGICSNAVNDMLHVCFCSKKFSGEQCEIYNEPCDHGKWWIFALIGCTGLILIMIQLVALLVIYSRKKHEEKTRMVQRERNDHSTPVVYDSPMQGHKEIQPFATNWVNVRQPSY